MTETPTYCTYCATQVIQSHWRWTKDSRYTAGGKWLCVARKRAHGKRYRARVDAVPERKQRKAVVLREYYLRKPDYLIYKAYKSNDRLRYSGVTLTWDAARDLMALPCTYCTRVHSQGLDRLDNAVGHTLENVVPCCKRCNFILGDLPAEAKQLLSPGLKAAYLAGYLEQWVIPTKRERRNPRDVSTA